MARPSPSVRCSVKSMTARRARLQKPAAAPAKAAAPAASAPRRPLPRQPPRRRLRMRRWRPSVRKLRPPKAASIAATVRRFTGKDGRVTKGDMLAAIEKAAPRRRRSISRRPRCRSERRAGRRCGPRRAGEDDAPAPDHRAAPEGGAEHRRHAHDLQRGRHDHGHGAARALQGRVREEARQSSSASWASSSRPACRR